jgi:hypothetical protein
VEFISRRRRAASEFRRGFQPTGRLENIPASRERRLNSIVADATWKNVQRPPWVENHV